MVLAKESCCCFKVNFHRGEFAIVADADKHCVDKAPGWISSLPLLPKEWQRAALCSSASRRGQLHCFVCFILLRGSQMGFFLLEAPVKASVVSCHLKVGADSGVELSMSWIRSQTWGIIAVQLQMASSSHVHPCGCCTSWCRSKVAVLCLLPMSCHWLQSSSGQTELRKDDLSFFTRWLGGEGEGCCYIFLAVT